MDFIVTIAFARDFSSLKLMASGPKRGKHMTAAAPLLNVPIIDT